MATSFKNKVTINVGTSATIAYQASAGTTSTLVGLSIANTTTEEVNVNVTVTDSSTNTTGFILKNAPIAAGGALIVIGGEQKLVLEENDSIKVQSSAAGSVDVVASALDSLVTI